jgi:hypothetical protein
VRSKNHNTTAVIFIDFNVCPIRFHQTFWYIWHWDWSANSSCRVLSTLPSTRTSMAASVR